MTVRCLVTGHVTDRGRFIHDVADCIFDIVTWDETHMFRVHEGALLRLIDAADLYDVTLDRIDVRDDGVEQCVNLFQGFAVGWASRVTS